MMKRILCLGDLHSGNQAGLTPPSYWYPMVEEPRNSLQRRRNKFAEIQRQVWGWYKEQIEALQPIDVLLDLGDNTDGRGEKSGSTELITPDQNLQCDMAVRALEIVKVKAKVMVYGSPYHSATDYSDWEDIVADGAHFDKIGSREFVDVNGVIFDLRHKVSKSSVPHGLGTLLAKQRLWNLVWSDVDLQPNANIILRGHIHEYAYDGRHNWVVISIPALEWSTKYGSRVVDGIVNIGMVYIDVEENGEFSFKHLGCTLGILKADTLVI